MVLALFALLPGVAAAEVIRDFSATYDIQSDGAVLVTERIRYDFEDAERHGIFRTLETDHPQSASSLLKKRSVAIDVMAVSRDGSAESYVVTPGSGKVEIRIGDPDSTIAGLHTYDISYILRGALSYGTDGAELYWNATGHDWPVVIERAVIEVVASADMLGAAQTCYRGVVGSTDRCAASIARADTDRWTFTAENLTPGEGMTIAQEVDSTMVAEMVIEEGRWVLIVVPLALAALMVLVYAIYRRQTYYKPDQPIIAQYEPYAGLLPMYTGVIFDGRLDPHDIAAGIVYLAEQGFIKIKHIETKVLGIFSSGDYEITLLRPVGEAANEALQSLLTLIFSAPGPGKQKLFLGIKFTLVSKQPTLAEVGETVLLSALKTNAAANSKTILALQKTFTQQLQSEGYFEIPFRRLLPLQRRTRKGYEARFHLLGFKEFLSVTDKERFAFHNVPEKSPELFMQYLPYAIALGVEKEWAQVFEGITIPNPDWYESSAGLHAFSATAFTTDLSTFTSSFNASSGTSGSSGGGSSGGGGGGGGGGSW